jgi:hypothetical protein
MKNSGNNNESNKRPAHDKPQTRPDLQDGSRGKDLSYLNEMPQMGGYEGVKAGVPSPKEKSGRSKNNMADES